MVNNSTMDEKHLIELIDSIVGTDPSNLLGNNEDAIAVQIENSRLVINIDGWVASTDRIPGFSFYDCGYRAAINSMSDIYAKGAKPQFLVASLSLPSSDTTGLEEIVTGIKSAAENYNVKYLGGDLNEAKDLIIDVVVIGIVQKTLVSRKSAKVGDDLYWLGPPLGENAAAFGILLNNWSGNKSDALDILRNPKLYPQFLDLYPSSAIDCSDGLARSLHILATESKVGIDLILPNKGTKFVSEVVTNNQEQLVDLMLYGGEELGIVFTSPSINEIPNSCIRIGKITNTNQIIFDGQPVPNRGWDHFA